MSEPTLQDVIGRFDRQDALLDHLIAHLGRVESDVATLKGRRSDAEGLYGNPPR